nr:hypothetical protein [Tanacetum cinerariifolium]
KLVQHLIILSALRATAGVVKCEDDQRLFHNTAMRKQKSDVSDCWGKTMAKDGLVAGGYNRMDWFVPRRFKVSPSHYLMQLGSQRAMISWKRQGETTSTCAIDQHAHIPNNLLQ